jgi:hypothetical protein
MDLLEAAKRQLLRAAEYPSGNYRKLSEPIDNAPYPGPFRSGRVLRTSLLWNASGVEHLDAAAELELDSSISPEWNLERRQRQRPVYGALASCYGG